MELTEIRRRLIGLSSNVLCDAAPRLRMLSAGIKPFHDELRMVGVVRTVDARGDSLTVLRAVAESQPGEVLMIQGGSYTVAVLGEIIAIEARNRGLAGIVVDGAVRDHAKLPSLEFPVYARNVYPRGGSMKDKGATQVPIECGGVNIFPDDIAFGDLDGILVGDYEIFSAAIPLAEFRLQQETWVLMEMEKGKSLLEISNYTELNDSQKKFKLLYPHDDGTVT